MSARSFAGLIADIELGKESLQRILQHQVEVFAWVGDESNFFRTSAAGVVLHDFYNAVEKTFQQIALEVDGGLPLGDAWHQQLLWRMTVAVPARRPAVIDSELAQSLAEYLRFRHLFHHIYGFDLDWERIEPLLVAVPATHAALIAQIERFTAFLTTLERDLSEAG
ncbi:MAG: hypothetical protein K1X65_22405 [Caldilineales bacterium]|nr:hypothetical protein [Caldilineales bacterium]MCW5860115.1 hypothetical protein [Caldilineales bacterium]